MQLRLAHLLTLGFFACSVVALIAAPRPQTAGQNDREQLQGTWHAVATKGYGKDVPAEELRSLTLTFKDDHMAARYGKKSAEAAFQLIQNEAGPSQVDFTVTQGPDAVKGKKLYGIYLLEGDTLKILYRDPGKPRPASFMVEDEPGVYTVRLKKNRS